MLDCVQIYAPKYSTATSKRHPCVCWPAQAQEFYLVIKSRLHSQHFECCCAQSYSSTLTVDRATVESSWSFKTHCGFSSGLHHCHPKLRELQDKIQKKKTITMKTLLPSKFVQGQIKLKLFALTSDHKKLTKNWCHLHLNS